MTALGRTGRTDGDRAWQRRRPVLRRLCAVAALPVGLLGGMAAAGSAHPSSTTPSSTTTTTASMLAITLRSPQDGASYERGARIVARFRCTEPGMPTAIVSCRGTVATGRAINTKHTGRKTFTVTATDTSGTTLTKTVHYAVWGYANPVRAVAGLQASRIDMGVDYSGSGPILAIGEGRVVTARYVPGPESCWGKTCAPAPGGWVVYRLLDGPFAGKYIYAVENITIKVKAGQIVRPGQTIAVLHPASPNLEIGWAAGHRAETLSVARHHQCTCIDPGGWSAIEGRNFDQFLMWLGAPSGYLQETPAQAMPHGWPRLPAKP